MQFKVALITLFAAAVTSVAAYPTDTAIEDLLLRRDMETDTFAILTKRGCELGQRKCFMNVPAKCNAHGTYIMGSACKTPTKCSGGVCVAK